VGCLYQKNQDKSRLDWYGENAPGNPVGAMGEVGYGIGDWGFGIADLGISG